MKIAEEYTIVEAIRKSDAKALCEAVWDSHDVWSHASNELERTIVKRWSTASVDDATMLFEESDAWRRVAGESGISLFDFVSVVDSATKACWFSHVQSALDRLREERKEIETQIQELEGLLYFGYYGQQNKW